MKSDEIQKTVAGLRSYRDETPFEIEELLRHAQTPEDRKLLRAGIRAVLESDAPLESKQCACKTLAVLGPEAALSALETMLKSTDPHLVEAACYAIGEHGGPECGAILRRALGARASIAIVNLLGSRRDALAAPELAKLSRSQDAVLAKAAVAALGKIATEEARSELWQQLRGRGPAAGAVPGAILTAAGELADRGQSEAARSTLEQLAKADVPPHVLRGVALQLKATAQTNGFMPLWNGTDLSDFTVDTPSVWKVRNGVIIGRHEGLKYNEFLRTRKLYRDFVLRASLRLIDGYGNTGIQFRSEPVPNSHEVKGYQADGGQKYWGALYDESRRNKILAGPPPQFLEKFDPAAWHDYEISAQGNKIGISLDGKQTVAYTETEPDILQEGFIALQVHSDPKPVEVWFRNLAIRVL
jgi:hypothetical protein